MKVTIAIAVLITLILVPKTALALPTAKYTLLVLDEEGETIQGANASISFMKPKSSGWGGQSNYVEGKTNEEGFYTGQGVTERYGVYGADAVGYYGTSFKYSGFTGVSGILGFRKWQPWNPTLKVVLKKKINPIAMYAYSTGASPITIPDTKGIVIGYDLVKNSWVSPYGKGVTADFLFKLEGEFKSIRDNNVKFSLKFTNAADGIQSFTVEKRQGSRFISDHHAPLAGYLPSIQQSRVNSSGKKSVTSYDKEADYNYYFRVRCDGGDESTCLYGKIYNRIGFSPRGSLSFSYYLNPTLGDTNVEFDPKKNLFKNLENKITAP